MNDPWAFYKNVKVATFQYHFISLLLQVLFHRLKMNMEVTGVTTHIWTYRKTCSLNIWETKWLFYYGWSRGGLSEMRSCFLSLYDHRLWSGWFSSANISYTKGVSATGALCKYQIAWINVKPHGDTFCIVHTSVNNEVNTFRGSSL